jgi:hypothetical protein
MQYPARPELVFDLVDTLLCHVFWVCYKIRDHCMCEHSPKRGVFVKTATLDDLLEDFDLFDDRKERLQYVLELGDQVEGLPDE